ncbi:hypothetical protein VQH23_19450 [Pararoseomonas sp. SCSIO 73927]|uniref:hypothetical protein n=1 Tax=Pararoseomonas sp. SCSIO 73927 TaxID=3114537 RepID=UPI0030D0FB28
MVLVAGTLVSSFTSVHLYRLPPEPAGRRGAERAILSANLALAGLAGLLVAAVAPLLGPGLGTGAAAVLVAGSVIGLCARSLAASRGAMALSAAVSAFSFAVVFLMVALELALGHGPSVPLLLVLMGLAQALAGGAVIRRLSGPGAADFGPAARRRWRVLARRSGWSLLAGASNEVFTRLGIFTVPLLFGAPALAGLAAASTMLRPATLLAGAFGSGARGPLAARRHAGDARGFWRLLVLGAAVPTTVTLAWSGVVAALWPLVSGWIYGGRYEGLETEVLLWGAVFGLGCCWVAGLAGLQTLGRLRSLALAELGGAVACAAAMVPMLLLLGPRGALVATILGGLVQVTLLARAVSRGLRAGGEGPSFIR